MADPVLFPAGPPPTVADVERIAALADPVVRNLQITQCYFELSTAVASRIGPGANWCTFATWASRQAGQTIRKEDLARTLEAKLRYGPAAAPLPEGAAGDAAPAATVDETIWQVLDPTAPFDRAGDAVARGNLKVFAEIGHEFARFCATCLENDAYDGAALDAFCAGLRPGDPPDGQHYLRAAFARYYDARFEPDAGRRAQLLLLANVEIGFHEQTRLQPEIVAAMEAPVIDPRQLRDRVLAALFPAERWSIRLRRAWDRLRGRPSPVDPAVDRLVALVRDEARFLISDQLMAIELPQATRLRLGRDLRAEYPASLQAITEPALRDLLARIDPTPDTTRASGAADWGDLADRLHFILELFRCYQEWPPLFDAPFTPAQVAALKGGSLPKGRL
ncbi:MAG: hypothetical protein H6640_16620 [Caldilineaceae bacterium]|nr:hypothetical protein [Caldilineaceae bacterium]